MKSGSAFINLALKKPNMYSSDEQEEIVIDNKNQSGSDIHTDSEENNHFATENMIDHEKEEKSRAQVFKALCENAAPLFW